jgi:hypothetical protein
MLEVNIFPEADDTIVCNTPTGEKIEVSVFDIDDMIVTMYESMELSFRNNRRMQLRKMVELFAEKYSYRMSMVSMDALIALKEQKMNILKKSASPSQSQLSFTESNPEPTETSES